MVSSTAMAPREAVRQMWTTLRQQHHGVDHAGDGRAAADGVDAKVQTRDQGDACKHRNQRSGHALGHARPQHQNRQARQADSERLHVKGSQVLHHASELIRGLDGRGARRIGKPHKILELTDDDGDGDAGGKARGDGMRHKADERAQAHDAHNYQQHARDDGSRHQSAHAVGRHDTGNDGDERRRGTGDLYAC